MRAARWSRRSSLVCRVWCRLRTCAHRGGSPGGATGATTPGRPPQEFPFRHPAERDRKLPDPAEPHGLRHDRQPAGKLGRRAAGDAAPGPRSGLACQLPVTARLSWRRRWATPPMPAAEPQPGFLDGSPAPVSEPAIWQPNRPQVGPVRPEPLRQPVHLGHRHILRSHSRQSTDEPNPADVSNRRGKQPSKQGCGRGRWRAAAQAPGWVPRPAGDEPAQCRGGSPCAPLGSPGRLAWRTHQHEVRW